MTKRDDGLTLNPKYTKQVDLKREIDAERAQSPRYRAASDVMAGELVIARKLAELREMAGLGQEDIAEMMGTSQSAVSRLESASYAGRSLSSVLRHLRAAGYLLVDIKVRRAEDNPVVTAAGQMPLKLDKAAPPSKAAAINVHGSREQVRPAARKKPPRIAARRK